MDNFSGDVESANKGSASKVTKETTGIGKAKFLSILNSEHSRLPDSFDVEPGILSGVELLRAETANRKVEVGGILFRDNNKEPKIKVISPSKELAKSNIAYISYRTIDEGNIDFYLETHQKHEGGMRRALFEEQVYFVDSNLVGKYRHFFEAFVQEGREVIIDGIAISPVHTHPSGNLPSQGDFAHVVWGPLNLRSPEIVVTSDWVYFLIPTKQTPDLYKDPSGKFQLHDLKAMYEQEYQEEIVVVDHLIASPEGEEAKSTKDSATNAVRLKMLQDNCAKYNVGFYALEKGKSLATRIV